VDLRLLLLLLLLLLLMMMMMLMMLLPLLLLLLLLLLILEPLAMTVAIQIGSPTTVLTLTLQPPLPIARVQPSVQVWETYIAARVWWKQATQHRPADGVIPRMVAADRSRRVRRDSARQSVLLTTPLTHRKEVPATNVLRAKTLADCCLAANRRNVLPGVASSHQHVQHILPAPCNQTLQNAARFLCSGACCYSVPASQLCSNVADGVCAKPASHCNYTASDTFLSAGTAASMTALLAAKARIVSDPSGYLASWKPSLLNPCGVAANSTAASWQDVTCDAPEGSIVEINLANANLSGSSLADELSMLANLTKL
jgi:hypothetical protein